MLSILKKKLNKNDQPIIQGLWIGNSLSVLERLCITSFIKNGYEFHLYTYGSIDNVPENTILKDGREILPENLLFTYPNGSYSAFSVVFRYALLYKKGGVWVDMDVICLKPFTFKSKIVIPYEPHVDYVNQSPTTYFLKAKKKSKVMKCAYNEAIKHRDAIINGELEWGLGLLALSKAIERFKLEKYIQPWQIFATCNYDHVNSLIEPEFSDAEVPTNLQQVPEETVVIHFWHEMFRRKGIDKNRKYPDSTIFEELKRKYCVT